MLALGALTALCAVVLVLYGPGAEPKRVRVVAQPAVAPPVSGVVTAENFDAAGLRSRLQGIAASRAGVYGVVVHDPVTGQTVALNARKTFYAASIGKLPALFSLYAAAHRGELSLEEPISILPTDVQSYGAGVLHTFPPHASISLRECGGYLIGESDNTAWVMLDRRLGPARIQQDLEALGAEDTDYVTHHTTPGDVLTILEAISDPSLTSERLSGEMLDTMTDTAYEDRIPAVLPPDVSVAHKVGSYGESFGDAGMVSYTAASGEERSYYLVILSEGTTEADAGAAIREMSAAVHAALTAPGGEN